MEKLHSISTFEQAKTEHEIILLYINNNSCVIGGAAQPKVQEMINDVFPKIKAYEISLETDMELTGYLGVFVPPTILVFLEGKEYIRKSGAFGIGELQREISRLYEIFYK